MKRQRLPRVADRLPLGSDGLHVSPICLGIVGEPAVVTAAFEAGVNFFFLTADMHWPAYEATRRGLADLLRSHRDVRDRIVVAGVCYPTQPEFCEVPFLELIQAVPGLGRLDVLLAGGAYAADMTQRLPIYVQHRMCSHAGAKAIGATFHDRAAAREALLQRDLDIAFVRYNTMHPGAQKEVFFDLPQTDRPLLFNFKSTAGYLPPSRMAQLGLPAPEWWQPAVTDHYRFALTRPELDGLLVALRRPAEVDELVAALARGPLDQEEEQYLLDVAGVASGAARIVPER